MNINLCKAGLSY